MVLISHVWLLSPWNVASATVELNFKYYIIMFNLNLYNHMFIGQNTCRA